MSRRARYPEEAVMDAMTAESGRVIPLYFKPDCCIGSTRAGIMALKDFGIQARALPCDAVVLNPAYRERVESGRPAASVEEMRAWDDGSWTVGIGFGSGEPGKWAGHLVILTESGNVVDLSITQANRPAHGIDLEPLWFPAEPELLTGTGRQFVGCGGSAVGYQAKPDAPDWRKSPDWGFTRAAPLAEHLASATLERLRRSATATAPRRDTRS